VTCDGDLTEVRGKTRGRAGNSHSSAAARVCNARLCERIDERDLSQPSVDMGITMMSVSGESDTASHAKLTS